MGEVISLVTMQVTDDAKPDNSYPRLSKESPYRQKSTFAKYSNTWDKVHETNFPENLFVDYDFLEFSELFKQALAKNRDDVLRCLGQEVCFKYAHSLNVECADVKDIAGAIVGAWVTMARNEQDFIEDISEDDDEIMTAMQDLVLGHKYIMKYLLERHVVQYKRTEGRNRIYLTNAFGEYKGGN